MIKLNKKRFILVNKLNVLFIFFIILLGIVPYAFSRYETVANSNANVDIALYLVDGGYQYTTIALPELIPSDSPNVYNFSVSNFNGDFRTETSLEYELKLRTTTNLPLEYHLYKNEDYTNPNAVDIINDDTTQADSDGTFFRTLKTSSSLFGITSNETNYYTLVIYFPLVYNNYAYQSLIESVEIIVDSRQVFDDNS